jgi:hypothetical protein
VVAGSTVTLSWTAIPGRTYRVQYKTDLNENNWSELGDNIIATGNTASKTDAMVGNIRFYRVELLP